MTINERLFDLLKEQNTPQKEFSKATGISEQTISAWKSRKTDPPANLLYTIADYFSVSLEFLVTGSEIVSSTDTNYIANNMLSVDERMLLDTYREMTNNGKTHLLNKMKEIWANNRLPCSISDPRSKSYHYSMREKNIEDAG